MEKTPVPSKGPQWRAALCANLGAVMVGVMLGWTAFIEDKLEKFGYNGFKVTANEFDWISGMLSLGAILGASTAGPLSDIFGRKKAIIVSMIPCLFGEGFMVGALNPAMLMVSRFLFGVGSGAMSCVGPMFVDEIAHVSLRGTLGSLFEILLIFGVFLCYVAGLIMSTFNFFLFCGVFPLLLVILMCWQPESPYYLIMKNHRNAARKSLRRLRGNDYSIEPEIHEITEILEQMKREKLSLLEMVQTRTARLGVFLSLTIVSIQQFSAVDAITFYTTKIFEDAGSSLAPKYCTLVSGATCLGATILGGFLIDHLGRKFLLLLSSAVCALSLTALGGYFFATEHYSDLVIGPSVRILPLITIGVYLVSFSFGLGPVTWMIVPELVPPGARSAATSLAFAFTWFWTFLISTFFEPLCESIGEGNTFFGFGVISALGFIILLFFLPETKGKTRDEIQDLLGG